MGKFMELYFGKENKQGMMPSESEGVQKEDFGDMIFIIHQ